MDNKFIVKNEENSKKTNKFKKFLHSVFVKNIGYKAVALGVALVLWVLVVGLGF
jgi:hypothetical protein